MVLITNGRWRGQMAKLRSSPLFDLFDAIYISEAFGQRSRIHLFLSLA
ncbi:MAG: hypothetical protein AAF633_23385 [Chloroflexota bacterium]